MAKNAPIGDGIVSIASMMFAATPVVSLTNACSAVTEYKQDCGYN